MPSFHNGAVEIAYLDEGEGDPIVLVHGFASSKNVNWVYPTWVSELKKNGRRVIALDNRGHGESGKLYDPAQYEVAVMAGDGQMDPHELHMILEPVASGKVAYSKGNRLTSGVAWQKTPHTRYLGNAFLSLLTKIASGYWHVADTQSGYTAISADALRSIDLDDLYPSYGYPNDMLIRLNVQNLRVADVHITPRYGIGERSSMKVWKVIPTVSFLLLRGFMFRMFEKYVIRDFHPLVFFYALGFTVTFIGLALGLLETFLKITRGDIAVATIVLVALLLVSGLQLLLFAMWFDMEYNKELR